MSLIATPLATADLARKPRRDGRARSVGRIDVHEDAVAANAAWEKLEETCPGSIYQTRRFLLPWLAAFAGPLGITPMLVVAHDAQGAPVAFLPFGVREQGPFRVAEFLGGKDSNANMGLFSPGFDFSRDDLVSLLRAAAAKARLSPDIFRLANQPERWEDGPNPLDIFPHQASASFLHGARLTVDAAASVAAKERAEAYDAALDIVKHAVETKKSTSSHFSAGIGTETLTKGSKASEVRLQSGHVSCERNWPPKTSVTRLLLRSR